MAGQSFALARFFMTFMTDYQALLTTAIEAAAQAGQLIVNKLNQPRESISKGFRDIVTDADIAAQKAITDLIQERFPDHGFVAEEEDSRLPEGGPVQWIIDPIDGTNNYSRQLPGFTVSIAAASDHHLLVGAIYDPLRQEMFSAVTGQGASLNNDPIRSSSVPELGQSVVGLGWAYPPPQRQQTLDGLYRLGNHVLTLRSNGSAALGLAYVASGRLDAYLEYGLCLWDVAAGGLLIECAGGTFYRHPLQDPHRYQIVASNAPLTRSLARFRE